MTQSTNQPINQNLILTGFMGTGKTTVGKLLAARLKRPFLDTDALIEREAEQSIPDMFAQHGEAYFRQLEAALAQRLSQQQGLVISTGGGLMLNAANAAALGNSGQIFCLVASADEIFARLQKDSDHRPLLSVPNPHKHIAELLEARAADYGRFPLISTANRTPEQIAAEILALFATD